MDHERTSHPSIAHSLGSQHPESITPPARDNNSASGSGSHHSGSTAERRLVKPSEGQFTANPHADLERGPVSPPPTARDRDSGRVGPSLQRSTSGHYHDPYLDHVVPTSTHWHQPLSRGLDEKGNERYKGRFAWLLALLPWKRDSGVRNVENQWECGTLGARLAPTIKYAEDQRERFAQKALALGWAVNVAIALQVLLGALTTALAAAITTAKQAQVSTAILGGLSTLVASFLARVRGSGEPELSIMRVKDLEHFIRDCRGFELDHGHEKTVNHHHCPVNKRLLELRQKLEDLLGNASGERKLSATGITPAGTTTGAVTTVTAPPTRAQVI